MSRMTSWTFDLSPACSLSSSQSLPKAPLSFAFGDGSGTLTVEVGHDADVALVAPFGGVVYPYAHDAGIVGGIPRLRYRLAQQAPYARGLSRAAAARPASRSCQRAPSLITCASKSAVKCVFGRTFQGILVACTPSLGQSALGSAQCTIVSYCQMLRCHKVLSRVSQVPHFLWHTGHSSAWPFLWATLTWSLSCAPSRSLN